ncbi:hypothetical protein SAMN05421837_102346 [Amycolatopsis pretoriensis]|uniref:Uncharacterized protein n=1 Tax=Amycolatopsis pretoriensis TaxID=218821 RepID=A0A1H5QC84_9PSEU|nr:hypothetical protein [Amycolatopsis pretoriensis]SEF23675.1 hypothetical protein SAMN05421837_102346 [Amycolatopsis pretoriensis]
MSPREGPSRPKFGRIDPYCLMAVLPVLLVAGIIGSLVNVALGLGCAVFAGLIVLFDSWANRPSRAPAQPAEDRASRPAAARPPVRRAGPPPAVRTQVARAQAPRAQAPRGQAPRAQVPRAQAPRGQAPRARQAPGGAPYR